ncbi:SulP family inorganic anion transporter [Reichenbachiella carrageenanivorans]|uniref:SulP family inorganic anion transporter n=1 Tax=Reichenbachiella carrageenanivorans TaxID=2979869 RepID=A0ABY6D531_9BACT|nr:SulP family inorganic anion transporter [Reichenbachiella carrageenanivorans]UXX81246.1 SulP family inorganic anion transporter [Reichenbachiella carrageenanivorans]
MKNTEKNGFFDHIGSDLPASLVVFLVAVPLCLGIALASGAPLFSGIIAGIVGGIVVALISQSQLGVSGPAAGLAVIVLTAIGDMGSFENFLTAVVIAGIIQVLLGVFKTGVFAYYLPSSVIKGMLSGIGVIIILKQIPHAFGYDLDHEGDMDFFQPDGHNTFSELFYAWENITPGAMVISIVGLALILIWDLPFMKKLSFTKIINGPLVAVGAGIGLNVLFEGNEFLSLHGDHVVNIPVTQSMGEFFGQFTTPNFAMLAEHKTYVVAFTIAIIASIETLLSVEAADKMDPERRITPTNRELIAQGIGNSVSGLIGGLPITQVIVRTSANIQSGGKTRASAFFHGLMLLLCVIAIPHVLNLIPLASLAAVLLVVGYKLVKPSIFKAMYKTGSSQFYSFMVTIVAIVFSDLLTGIGLGLAVAAVFILWNNFKTPYHFDPNQVKEGEPIRIELSEDVSFLNKAGFIKTFGLLPENSHVIIDATRSKDIHWDVLELIEDYKINAKSKNIKLELIGFKNQIEQDAVEELEEVVK